MFKFMRKVRKNQRGATAIEYGLIAALISIVVIATLGKVGKGINNTFSKVASAVGG